VAKVIFNDHTKRRLAALARGRRRGAAQLGQQADEQIERLLIRRFDRLVSVRRFVVLWISLFVLLFFLTVLQIRSLSSHYQSLQPVAGGMYSEGLSGTFTNANPLYATGSANSAISRLIFPGLFKFDTNGNLLGDLAHTWKVDNSGKNYVVSIKPNITWQDGSPFTADDVVFTYTTIQDPAAQSSQRVNWQGIKVTKLNDYAVNFNLPNNLSSFPYSLTNGIIPKHLLGHVAPQDMRSASFNTDPVGTGPFKWKFVEVKGVNADEREQRITLEPFDKYYGGRPKLDGFSIITFNDDRHLIKAFKDKQVNAMSGLDELPAEFSKDSNVETHITPLTSSVMAFFNNSQPVLNDANVRKALVASINNKDIVGLLSYPAKVTNGPLLSNQLGYDATISQTGYNPEYAKQVLDLAGWTSDGQGHRIKNGQILQLALSSQDTADYTKVAQFLQQQWAKIGVKVSVRYYSSDDLQRSVIANHGYDILLYGISIGADPDVFAYWDSSQASISSQGHLNLSEYKSAVADQALEAGRTRSDPALRALKYKAFLSAWTADAPALSLYQPNYVYITRGPVSGYDRKVDTRLTDRYSNVSEWMIRQQRKNL
jgi:peptide/nickel transport system substrate-binding protein